VSQAPAQNLEHESRTGRSLWADARRRIVRDTPALICLGVIVLYAVLALLAGFLYSDWEDSYDYDNLNKAPSLKYPLGTDEFGRSVLAKTILGIKVSMTVGFLTNIIAIPLGMVLGAIAGYYGGKIDDCIVWLFTTLAAVPGIIRVIAFKFAFQNVLLFEGTPIELDLSGMTGLCLALAISSWIGTCRLVRAETMKMRELDYVMASRAIGTRNIAVLFRHILPNVLHLGIINVSLGFIGAITAEVALSYLGLGVTDMPSWGQMIVRAKLDLIPGRWWQLASAGTAMFVLVLALNIFGDRLRDALDPKLRNV